MLGAGGVCLVVGLLIGGGPLWSDSKPAAASPRSRVAVVNLSHVLKNYEKYKTFQKELRESIRPFQERTEKNKKAMEALTEEQKLATGAPERLVRIEKKLKQLQRDNEDTNQEARAALEKKQNEELKILYQDVQEAVRRHARAQDLELVVHFNDPVNPAELHSPANIARKMQAAGCTPIFVADGVDITSEILADLNERARRKET
jgi:Skp family chaperone for outer membrane proteins